MLPPTLRRTLPSITSKPLTTIARSVASTTSSSNPNANSSKESSQPVDKSSHDNKPDPPKRKTQAQLDAELQEKMAAMAGDGGESGVEYENGEPVAMKRSVKSNMFRYI